MEEADLDPLLLHLDPELRPGGEGPQGVHQNPHGHTPGGGVRGLLEEEAAGDVVPEDVGLQEDLPPGRTPRLPHGGEGIPSVEIDLDPVATVDRGVIDLPQEDLESVVFDSPGKGFRQPPHLLREKLGRELVACQGAKDRAEQSAGSGHRAWRQ